MKPFDLEAAKRGEPVWVRADKHNPWYEHAWFVGVTKTGRPIIEWPDGEVRSVSNAGERLCMAPRKKTVYVNVYDMRLNSYAGNSAATFDSEALARDNADRNGVGMLAVAVPIEIGV